MSNTDLIVDFLRKIGFTLNETGLPSDCFLPGVSIEHGVISFDPRQLLSPGDLLHEAGHLALLTPAERSLASGKFVTDGGYEMGAIAWSYAACLHLGLPLEVLFHDQGYRGGAEALRENFSAGRYIGVPMLAWLGLAVEAKRGDPAAETYPHMLRWLVT